MTNQVGDYLDPATLTAEQLYKLQSITWSQGAEHERERIVKMLEDRVSRLDQMRPESYKSVADTADLRIRTYRHIIKLINGEQSNEPEK
jgi:hypothetical protein